jgi:hypothetical protein
MAILYFKGGTYFDGGIKSAAKRRKSCPLASCLHPSLKARPLANLLSNT